MTEHVTLILGDDRLEVSRKDLISKSVYFAALFSSNYRDFQSSEHRINYDIDIDTLRTFVDWVSDQAASVIDDHYCVKPSLVKYVTDGINSDGFLELLQFSVLFAAEPLITDLAHLVACSLLTPQESLQMWLLAKELDLALLRDLAKATCIDRIRDIPESLLLELPGEDFIELVGNVHIPVDQPVDCKFISELVQRWINHNVSPGDTNAFETRYPFTLQDKRFHSLHFKETYREQQQKHTIQCIVGSKKTSSNEVENCVYGWDGTTFLEIVQLPTFSPGSTNRIVGPQAVGRGFDIYLVGGEYGENTGNFDESIWRYSMISETWYYVTSMPRPRRHMAVAFVKEELFLIGGSQEITPDCSTVDVYNIYTGEWYEAEKAEMGFTSKSVICEKHGLTLHDYKKGLKIVGTYNRDKNRWKCDWSSFIKYGDIVRDLPVERGLFNPQLVMTYEHASYVLGHDDSDTTPKLFWASSSKHSKYCMTFLLKCLTSFNNQVSNGPNVIGFSHQNDTVYVEVVKIDPIEQKAESKIVYENERSDIRDFCSEDPIGCFNVLNPKYLHEIFVTEL